MKKKKNKVKVVFARDSKEFEKFLAELWKHMRPANLSERTAKS